MRAILVALLLLVTAAPGLADVPAVELVHPLVSLEGGRAVQVNAADEVVVLMTSSLGPEVGYVLLPPHPSAMVREFPCTVCNSKFTPYAIDDEGLAVGGRVSLLFGPGPFAATYAAGATSPVDLPTPPLAQDYGSAVDSNLAGHIVGTTLQPNEVPIFWWSKNGPYRVLPSELGGVGPFPVRINAGDRIIGNTVPAAGPRAAFWRRTLAGFPYAYLGELPGGATSEAHDIHNDHTVVGSSDDGSGSQVAVVWRPVGESGYDVEAIPSPFPGGSCSAATAINALRQVGAICTPPGGEPVGVVLQMDGTSFELRAVLDPLPGDPGSGVLALGPNGLAAGYSEGTDRHPVVWQFGGPLAAPALTPVAGWVLAAALAGAGVRHGRRRDAARRDPGPRSPGLGVP